MKDEATPEQIAMARRIASEMPGMNALQKCAFLDGEWDDAPAVQAALAAIIETTRLASSMAADTLDEARLGEIDNDLRCIKHVMVSRLADYDHLKEQSNAE